jgi:hypothetical protein
MNSRLTTHEQTAAMSGGWSANSPAWPAEFACEQRELRARLGDDVDPLPGRRVVERQAHAGEQ